MILKKIIDFNYFIKFFSFALFLLFLIFIYHIFLSYNLKKNQELIKDIKKLYSFDYNNIDLNLFKKKYEKEYAISSDFSEKFIYYKILLIVDYKLSNLDGGLKSIKNNKNSNLNQKKLNSIFSFDLPFKLELINFTIFYKILLLSLFVFLYFLGIKFFKFLLNVLYDFILKKDLSSKEQIFLNFYFIFFSFFIFMGFFYPFFYNFILNYVKNYLNNYLLFIIFVFSVFVLSYILFLFLLFYLDFKKIISQFFYKFHNNINLKKNIVFIILFFFIVFLSNLFFNYESNNLIIVYVLLSNFWELFFIFWGLVLFIPMLEEIIFRYYLINYLESFIFDKNLVIFLGALVFSLVHFENVLTLIFIFFFSVYLNYIYLRYRNLYFNFWVHSFWNLLNFLVLLII